MTRRPPSREEIRLARRILDTVEIRLQEQAADRKRAARLLPELLALPPAERGAAIAEQARFDSPGLAQRLLDLAEAASCEERGEAGDFVALAQQVVDRLSPRWGRAETAILQVRTLGLESEARRQQGRLAAAEVGLRQALDRLGLLPVGHAERAELCRLLARLRRDQEREDEAIALMALAAARYEALPDGRRAAGCRLELAWLHLEAEEIEDALRLFEQARLAGDIGVDEAGPYLSLLHGLALVYTDFGRDDEAEAAVAEAADWARSRPRRDRLRAQRIAASVAERRGESDLAPRRDAWRWRQAAGEGGPAR